MKQLPANADDLVAELDKLYPAIDARDIADAVAAGSAPQLLRQAAQREVVEVLLRRRDFWRHS